MVPNRSFDQEGTKVGNSAAALDDSWGVTCERERWAEAISADLDGELGAAERRELHEHLAHCAACRALDADLTAFHRTVRLRTAAPVPDLTGAILSRAHPPRPGRGEWVRYSLAVIALTELLLALPALVLGADSGAPVHVARHVGSLTVALAIGMLYAAYRPERSFGLLPIALALGGCLVLTAALDLSRGVTTFANESAHLLDLAGVALLWLLAGRPRPRLAGTGRGLRLGHHASR